MYKIGFVLAIVVLLNVLTGCSGVDGRTYYLMSEDDIKFERKDAYVTGVYHGCVGATYALYMSLNIPYTQERNETVMNSCAAVAALANKNADQVEELEKPVVPSQTTPEPYEPPKGTEVT